MNAPNANAPAMNAPMNASALNALTQENELLRTQLIQCTKAMRLVAEELRKADSQAQAAGNLLVWAADTLATARAERVSLPQVSAHDWVHDVLEFHRLFGQFVGQVPWVPVSDVVTGSSEERDLLRLREDLIAEEYGELKKGIAEGDVVQVADALADLIYVLIGTAVAFGIDLRPVWGEVHRSNMSKVGGPTRADGKILKPKGWQPPQIAEALKKGAL